MHSEWPQEQPPLQCSDGPHGSIRGFGLGGAGGGARDMGCGAAVGRAVPLRYPCVPNLAGFCIINGTMGTPRWCAYLRGQRARAASLREIPAKSPVLASRPADRSGEGGVQRLELAVHRDLVVLAAAHQQCARALNRFRLRLAPIAVGASHDSTVRQPRAQRNTATAPADDRSQVRSRGPPTARRDPIAAADRCKREAPVPAIDLGPASRAR